MASAVDILGRELSQAFFREPALTVSQWADAYAFFRDVGGAKVKWETSRAPYTREPMDATFDPEVSEITVKMCEQMGKTEMIQRIVQATIDQRPTRIQIVYPNDRVAKNQIKRKLLPALKLTPKTAARMGGRKNQDALTLEFDRTEIQTSGSNSPANVEGFAFGLSIIDELDRCEPDTEERTAGRGAALQRSLRIKVSTPTEADVGIDASYARSDRRRYHVPCPHCFRYDIRRFDDLRWPGRLKDGREVERSRDFGATEEVAEAGAFIVCKHCDKPIRHDSNLWQLRLGVWVPDGCTIGILKASAKGDHVVPAFVGVPAARRHRGYELTGLYRCFPSGVNPYGKMAAGLVQFRGNPTPEWWNRRAGLAHTPKGETADIATLKRACTPVVQGGYRFGTAPAWAVALVIAVDVQPNDVWATVYALGAGDDPDGQACGLVWCDSIPAPVGLGFSGVDALLERAFPRAGGGTLRAIGGPMDSGHRKEEVWAWGRRGGHRVVVRGLGGGTGRGNIESLIRWTHPEKLADGKTPRPDGVKVLQVNTHAWKQSAVSILQNAGKGPSDDATAALGGAMRLFLPEDTPMSWMAQVTSEQLVTVRRHGFVERHWQLKSGHTANHYFDDLVYFLAFCHAKGGPSLRDSRAPGGATQQPLFRKVGNLL